MKLRKTGKIISVTTAAFTAAGGFLADSNKTHLFNPGWTPHSKFHDAMTILLAAMLGSSSVYLLSKKDGDIDRQLTWATLLPSFFWAGSFAMPGAKGLEAEFPKKVKKPGGIVLNEGPVIAVMLALLGFGYCLAKKGK